MCHKRKRPRYIAAFVDQLQRRVHVTHPFHPLAGQELKLITYRRSYGHPRVECQDAAGKVHTIPLSWTDAAGGSDPLLEISAGRSFFRVEDLLYLVALLKRSER